MEFWFARHGQTEWNAERRFQGRLNSPLTELGRQQAMDQGEILRRNVPNLYETDLVISPLGRVIETVEIALPGMAYRIDDDLMEHDVGPISGLSLAERVAIDPRSPLPGPFTSSRRAVYDIVYHHMSHLSHDV